MADDPPILVVDDDAAIRALMKRVLQRAEYEVTEAANGVEALAKLRAQSFGAVILDLMMPVMSGFDVVRYLDTHDDAGAPCVLVVSAASDHDIHSVRSPRVHAVLRKPFDLPDLLEAVEHCVRKDHQRRE